MFNTSNIENAVDMEIADTGATVHFVLSVTPVTKISHAKRPLINQSPRC